MLSVKEVTMPKKYKSKRTPKYFNSFRLTMRHLTILILSFAFFIVIPRKAIGKTEKVIRKRQVPADYA
jgi:hypothetical protein